LRFEKNLAPMGEAIAKILQKKGGRIQAARVARGIRRHIDKMQASFWRDYYEDLFMNQFGYLLPKGDKGSVVLSAGSDEEGAEEDGWTGLLPPGIAQIFEESVPGEHVVEDDEYERGGEGIADDAGITGIGDEEFAGYEEDRE